MNTFKKRIISIILTAVLAISTVIATGVFVASTATQVEISSTENVTSGIKIKWNKDTSKSGYYIYRKSSYGTKWTVVKTVDGANYSSWTDTTAVNGKKYDYRVEAYKGDTVYTNSTAMTEYRLTTPSIKSISYDGENIHIKGSKNSSARGFEIQYSTSSDFSKSDCVKVYNTQLDKTLANLKCSKKYYFRIRAFKVTGDVTYYSGYSKVKNFKTKSSYNAYTLNLYTSLYVEPDSNSEKISLDYMTKVRLYQDYFIGSKGTWKIVKYDGKYYYAWIPSGAVKFTTVKPTYEYDLSACNKYQKEIVNMALDIFKNYDTEYDETKEYSDGSINPETGKYSFDCSGFVKYVHNTVMQKYIKTYKIQWNIIDLFKMKAVYNNDLSGEFNAITVCEGEYDYSKLQPGDVIFFNLKNGSTQGKECNHCGIYLGNKEFIHSMGSLNRVAVSLISGTFEDDFVKAVRYIPDKVELVNETITAPTNIQVYRNMACKTGTSVYKITKNSTFTLVCTNSSVGYVKFVDTDGKAKSGYIYQPKNRLPELYG